jgi:transcriptional regulator with PAS, ATPase and Fis domain
MNGAPKGRPVSEERRKQISETLKGRPAKQNNEPIKDIETEKTYESQKEAAKLLKVSRQTINKWTKSGKFIKV